MRRSSYRLRRFFQRHLTAAMLFASLVNAAVGRDFSQPVRQVRRRLYAINALEQLQKNFLRQVFRQRAVLKKVVGNAEDHALMLTHQVLKRLPVTRDGPGQRQLEPVVFKSRRLLQVPSLEQLYVPEANSGASILVKLEKSGG